MDKTGLITALRYRSVRKAIEAYRKAVEEAAAAHRALGELDEARLEHERARRRHVETEPER